MNKIFFSKKSKCPISKKWGRVLHKPTQEDWDLASKVASEDKVRWAIDGFGTCKASGEDGIFPGLLQHGIEIIISHIKNIFAACLAYGYIPVTYGCLEGSENYIYT
jgi:hypothetical protein